MSAHGTQLALALPRGRQVALGAALGRPEWLYPVVTILPGAHHVPFAFLQGMRMFVALSGILVGGGFLMAMTADPDRPALPGSATCVVLVAFAPHGRAAVSGEVEGVSRPGDSLRISRRS